MIVASNPTATFSDIGEPEFNLFSFLIVCADRSFVVWQASF